MIARIRECVYRLRRALEMWRIRGETEVPPEDLTDGQIAPDGAWVRTAATAQELASLSGARVDAMRPTIELWSSVRDPDQVQTLLDLVRSRDKDTFVELARALGVPPDRVERLWEGTVNRLYGPPSRGALGRHPESQRRKSKILSG